MKSAMPFYVKGEDLVKSTHTIDAIHPTSKSNISVDGMAGDYYKFNKEDAEPVSADTEPVSAETEEKIASTAANLCLDLITS
ncbi:hypothetical protein Tco_0596726 [Tanacetum coccineum]